MTRTRGQIAIEFVIIVIVVSIYLLTVVFPLAQNASNAASDTSRISLARQALDNVRDAVEKADANPGDSKHTIELVIPEKTSFQCNGASSSDLNFESELFSGLPVPPHCIADTPPRCRLGFSFVAPDIQSTTECELTSQSPRPDRYKKTIIVEKNNDTISIRD